MTQPNPTVAQAFDFFLEAKSAKGVVENTLYLYNWMYRLWTRRWPSLRLAEVEPTHIRQFILWLQGKETSDNVPGQPLSDDGQPLSGSSVHIVFRNLRTFFRWCELEDLLAKTPMRNVEAPIVDQKIPDHITEEESWLLLDRVRNNGDRHAFRDYVIHLFFMSTGVRLAELAGLDVEHIFFKDGFAKVFGKGRRERVVALGEFLPLDLRRYLLKYRTAPDGEPALFVNEQGHRLAKRGIQTIICRDIKHYLGRSLNRLGPHTYRHSFITMRLRQTRDIKGTSVAAGHKDLRSTERYTHLSDTDVVNGVSGKSYSPMDSVMRTKKPRKRKDSLRNLESQSKQTPNLEQP